MAKGKKTGGKNFLVGWRGGPGRPPSIPELKEIPRITKDSFNRMVSKVLVQHRHNLKDILSDPSSTNLEVALAKIIDKMQVHGDYNRLDALLNRLIGPAPKQIEISGRDGEPLAVNHAVLQLSTDELIQLYQNKKIEARQE